MSSTKTKKLGNNWKVFSVRGHNEAVSLRCGLYHSKKKPLSRAIVYLNGRTEWIEKNPEIPDWLELPDDCGFLTWDHRGQGASGGERSYIDNYDTYVADARKIISETLGTDIPYTMLAHSMGGLITLLGCLNQQFYPQAIALCSPLLGLPNYPFPLKVSAPLTRLVTSLGFGPQATGLGSFDKQRFETNRLTHDIDQYTMIRNSPYRLPSASFGWVYASYLATQRVFDPELLHDFTIPTLILYGSEERVVDPIAASRWVSLAREVSKAPVQLKLIHGARHELFSEIAEYRSQAISAIRKWFSCDSETLDSQTDLKL